MAQYTLSETLDTRSISDSGISAYKWDVLGVESKPKHEVHLFQHSLYTQPEGNFK